MKFINSRVTMLELDMFFMGKESLIHPLLIRDDESLILIDAGLPRQFEQLENELVSAGTSSAVLDYIFVSHQDLDHVGCLPELSAVSPSAIICAHELDAPYIRGDYKLIKEGIVPWQNELESLPSSRVDRLLKHDERLELGGGITVIHTPGHTDGHICFLLEETRQLVVGDALFYVDKELKIPPSNLTVDMPKAMESLSVLLRYDFDDIICYHGGVCQDGKTKIKKLMESYNKTIIDAI